MVASTVSMRERRLERRLRGTSTDSLYRTPRRSMMTGEPRSASSSASASRSRAMATLYRFIGRTLYITRERKTNTSSRAPAHGDRRRACERRDPRDGFITSARGWRRTDGAPGARFVRAGVSRRPARRAPRQARGALSGPKGAGPFPVTRVFRAEARGPATRLVRGGVAAGGAGRRQPAPGPAMEVMEPLLETPAISGARTANRSTWLELRIRAIQRVVLPGTLGAAFPA